MINSEKSVAFVARHLVRCAHKAVLCTNMSQRKNSNVCPFGSLVTIATTWDGSPILLLSKLAQHTQNILKDSRVCLLVDGTDGFLNPQQGPRVGIIGRIIPTKNDGLRHRFLRRNPQANLYANFGDFEFYKMDVQKYHYIGGFAQALWIEKQKVVLPKKDWIKIAASEEDILSHMNSSHTEALRLYGVKLLGKRGKYWNMIALDPEGLDLRCGNSVHRLNFASLVKNASQCRKELIKLATQAKDD